MIKQATIQVHGKEMNVFMDNGGKYYLNQSEVVKAIEIPESVLHDFLEFEQEALVLRVGEYKLMKEQNDIIPIEYVSAFWIEQGVMKGKNTILDTDNKSVDRKAQNLAIGLIWELLLHKCSNAKFV
ncbi:hypothetical protein JYQ62_17455 [Nostoc sp. UHCC 0702]|nr:hypothetical protein JYQ62_17455 [Nostoc sp. UHCC 0702]